MVYYYEDGRPSQYPTTLDHAIEVKHRVYNDEIKCTSCNMSSVKYTKTQRCVYCARRDAITFYNFHNGTRHVWTDGNTGEHFSQPEYNKTPVKISDDEWSEMVELSNLSKTDNAFSVSPDPCQKLGHIGLRRLGKCFSCSQKKKQPSPRQFAMVKGEKWYTPDTQCVKCDQTAPRRVDNGLCSGCVPAAGPNHVDQRETPDSILMREQPDMIIDKVTADECGMKVYRTGEPCRRGHTGWRYVKIGNCIPCLRGEK